MKRHDVPALLASRICHDLVSPVGAVQNGLDLLAEIAPPGLEEELALVRQSATRAADLLKFYRIAFGAADEDALVALPALREQADAAVGSGKAEWSWSGLDAGEIPRAVARLGAMMILCARSATLLGGTVSVAAGGDRSLRVVVDSQRLSLSEVQAAVIDGRSGSEDAGPRDIEFALLDPWAEAAGYRIQASRGPNGLCLEARPAPVQDLAATAT